MKNKNIYKILCIDHEGGYGGSSRSLYYLLKSLDKNLFEIEVWCGKAGPIQSIYKDHNILSKVYQMPTMNTVFSFTRNIISLINFSKIFIKNYSVYKNMSKDIHTNFDLVHFNHPNLYLLALFLKIKNKDKPFTFHMRTMLEDLYEGTAEYIFSKNINKFLSKFLAKKQIKIISKVSEKVIFISNNEKKSYQRLGGYRDGEIIYNLLSNISNNVHLKLIDEKRFKIAAIENYRWSRGTDRLIEIAEELKHNNRNDIVFVVAGDMTIQNSQKSKLNSSFNKYRTLIEYVKSKGLSNYFIFLGHVSKPEEVILGCNALVSLTRRAGPWGRSVIEAMKMQKLVISTGPNQGFITDNKTGIYIKNYDPQVLAKRIILIIDDKVKLLSMSLAGYKYINLKTDKEKNTQKIIKIWKKLVV